MTKKAKDGDAKLAWTASQRERRSQVEAGRSVLANLRTDKALISWAGEEGLYVRIDRRTCWGNPHIVGEDGDRDTVIEMFRSEVCQQGDLLARLDELRGKVLGCWCHPEPCHGGVLLELVEESPGEHVAPRRLRGSRKNGA